MAAQFLSELRDRITAYEAALRDSGGASQRQPCCSQCGGSLAKLRDRKQFLMQSVDQDGKTQLLCTVCMQGW